MKKILLLMLLSIAAHSQTLKQTTDNNILNQGNKGITALKLRNVLHAFVDSIRARGFGTVKSIAGTTNQISVTNNSGNYQLFLPSSISVNTINSNSSSIDNISVNDLSVMSNLTLPVGIANISGDMNLFGNLKFENGNQGNGKLLQSDAFGNANWWTPNYGVLSSPNNWTAANTFNSSIGFKSENSLTGHYSNYTFSNDGNFADGSLVINANKFTGGAVVSTPVIRINNDKVGIGVSYDDQFEKLAVNGTTILKEVSVTNDVIPANPYTKFRSFIDGTGNTGKYISYFDRFNGSSVTSSPTFVINQTGVNIGSILDPIEKLNVSGNVNVTGSLRVNGTAGAGFVSFVPQSSSPSTPASGFRQFATSAGLFAWRGSNGFDRVFDASTITANRIWSMKDASGTVPLESTVNTYTQNQIINASVGVSTDPLNLLHVRGNSSVGVGVRNSHLIIESAENAAVDVGAVLKFAGQSGNAVGRYSFGTIEGRKESSSVNNYSSYLSFHTIESNGGSSEKMRISSNGNVGIGTTSPVRRLDVRNNAGSSQSLGLYTSDYALGTTGTTLQFSSGATTGNTFYQLQTLIGGETGAGNLAINPLGGNVGIGTTTPNQKLELANAGAVSLRLFNSLANSWDITNTSATGQLRFTRGVTNDYVIFNQSGNVGIGIDPSAKFEIKSSATNNLGGLMLRATSSSNFPALLYENSTNGGTLDLFSSASLTTRISGNGDSYFLNGNIGIGTASPASNTILDINSTTRAVRIPRMTTTEINAIASPSAGMIVYNTTLQKLCYHNGTGWRQVTDSAM